MHTDLDVTHTEITVLLKENQRLLKENNVLLHKIRRDAKIAMALRVIWFAILIGVPFVLYYYIVEPNMMTLQKAYTIIESGAHDLSGMRQVLESIDRHAP